MAGFNNNQRRPQDMINTNGIQFYGDTGTLQLGFWSTTVNFRISPIRPEAERNQEGNGSVYDYNKTIRITLPVESAVILGTFITKELIPALEKNEEKHAGIISSQTNMVYVSTGTSDNDHMPYLAIFNGIGSDHRPEKMAIFNFKKTRIFDLYDPKTGENEFHESAKYELEVLADFLKKSILLYGHTAHAIAYRNANEDATLKTLRSGIAAKLGIDYQTQPVHYASRAAQADPWGNSPKQQAAPIKSASSMEDIAGLLNRTVVIQGLSKDHLYGETRKTKKIRIK